MLNQQCKKVKTGQIALSHYISNSHNNLFNNQLWEISIVKNMLQFTILSDIYELFMINYKVQNYKLFVDYALILLKFTLAGDKSFHI